MKIAAAELKRFASSRTGSAAAAEGEQALNVRSRPSEKRKRNSSSSLRMPRPGCLNMKKPPARPCRSEIVTLSLKSNDWLSLKRRSARESCRCGALRAEREQHRSRDLKRRVSEKSTYNGLRKRASSFRSRGRSPNKQKVPPGSEPKQEQQLEYQIEAYADEGASASASRKPKLVFAFKQKRTAAAEAEATLARKSSSNGWLSCEQLRKARSRGFGAD